VILRIAVLQLFQRVWWWKNFENWSLFDEVRRKVRWSFDLWCR